MIKKKVSDKSVKSTDFTDFTDLTETFLAIRVMGSAFTGLTDFNDLSKPFFLADDIWRVVSQVSMILQGIPTDFILQILLTLQIYPKLSLTRRYIGSAFTELTDFSHFTDLTETYFYQKKYGECFHRFY